MTQLKFPEDDGYEEEDGAEGGPASKEARRNTSTFQPIPAHPGTPRHVD